MSGPYYHIQGSDMSHEIINFVIFFHQFNRPSKYISTNLFLTSLEMNEKWAVQSSARTLFTIVFYSIGTTTIREKTKLICRLPRHHFALIASDENKKLNLIMIRMHSVECKPPACRKYRLHKI